jgi:hypothetical protein
MEYYNVNIVKGYVLYVWWLRFRFLAGVAFISFLHGPYIYGIHLAPYRQITCVAFFMGKATGTWSLSHTAIFYQD